MIALLKRFVIGVLPLSVRKRVAISVNRASFLDPIKRAWWATQLLTDFAETDPNGYHNFLWANHLGYARTYEADKRFGYANFNKSRRILFDELPGRLRECGLNDKGDIRTVLDVGCSLGYLLRYMETDVFQAADDFVGIDVDKRAIEEGQEVLAGMRSRVRLFNCDLAEIDDVVGDSKFDLVFASGVLLYFDEESAYKVVRMLARRTGKILVITGLADAEMDNSQLESSRLREFDGTWIHNIDRMLEAAGARIVARRLETGRIVDGNTIYFLYAIPGEE